MLALTRMFAVTALFTTLLLPAAQAAGIAYGALVDQLRIENKTKAELKETWKKHKGQEVTWSGTVAEVNTGKKNAKVPKPEIPKSADSACRGRLYESRAGPVRCEAGSKRGRSWRGSIRKIAECHAP